ncbi:hypothetical protein Ahy_B02g061355 [Arachis hypogaea]|uniref:Uncharacterized protein n=1 Tax=Arachis hypogaea TaxID=3818 RepID=A0A445AKV1_ARAHY|nr:hypothetical protein Ahy_B02g061355 [Arachis hypogaea]
MDVHLDIMFHHGRKFQKDEKEMTIYSPDKKACIWDIDVDTLDVFWVRNYYKELGYDRIGECWWHVPGRSLDIGLRALNCDDELREMCFMGEKNEGLVDVYFEHAVSTPEILEGNEIVEYVEGDHDDLREVSDEADPEPLQDETPNQANKPTTPADETPFNKNTEPVHNTSPPKTTEPTDPGANNPTTQSSNPNTTPNSIPSQATTAKPVTTTPPVPQKMKPNSNVNPNLKSNTTSSHKATANPKNASKPKPKPNQNSVSKPKPKSKLKIRAKAYCTRSASQVRTRKQHEKKKQVLRLSSSEDEHTTEDSSYDPGRDDSSTDEDVVKKYETKRREPGSKHAPAEGLAKSKRKFLNDDDALVVDDEDFLEVPVTGDKNLDKSYDPGAESDGANSWHSEEMKTPPPSEDEFSEEEPDDVFPVFRDGIRFGDLKLEVGMKFNTKWEFREAVREFTIQEGRRIQFIKNDTVRCRAECPVCMHVQPSQGPQAPKKKKKPGPVTKKRRKDADEEAPSQAAPEAPAQPPAPVEIDLSQPNYSDAQQSQHRSTCETIQVADKKEVLHTTIRIDYCGSTTRSKLNDIFQTGQLPEICPNTWLQATKEEEMKINFIE